MSQRPHNVVLNGWWSLWRSAPLLGVVDDQALECKAAIPADRARDSDGPTKRLRSEERFATEFGNVPTISEVS